MFVLIVIILTSVYAVVSDGVSSLITALLSSVMTLPVPYNGGGDYNGLLIALGIKPGVYNLSSYDPNTYSLPT